MSNQQNDTFANVDNSSDPQLFIECMKEQYASNPKLVQNKEETFKLMDLKSGQCVLDIGCGTGRDAMLMAETVAPDGHIYGVDFSQAMVLQASKSAATSKLPVTFQQGSIYELNFSENHFDRCRADKIFQHLADPYSAISELIRVTKPGGKIIIADPDHDSLIIDNEYSDITHRFVKFRSDQMAQGGIAHQLFRIFGEFGLRDVSVTPLTNIYTDYNEKKASSPYLSEIWIAQNHGTINEIEAEQWANSLEQAISKGYFFCMQTYMVTVGTKPTNT